MGAAVPQVVTESSASGAQVIDGSLKFDGSKSTALKRTPSSDGNRKTWTWSAWVKKHKDSRSTLFSAGATSNDTGFAAIEIETDEQLRYAGWNTLWKRSNDKFRDYNEFYHIVISFDVTQGTASNRVRLYKNGVEITDLANNGSLSNVDYPINDNVIHYIGGIDGGGGENITFNDYNMTQVYFIDGQALGPENFGFTDPLTNTWRPKKYTGDFNISSSGYAGIFAPYSTTARWNSFKTYTTVNENSTGHTLPMSNPSHYGGKALDLASGGFEIQTNNSAAGDFFMAIWVNLDSYETNKQFGVDMAGNYVFFETLSNGAIKVRHTGSGGQSSNSGYANDTNQWQHWALSRSGGSLRGFVDGEQIVTDTGGISGDNTVLANSKFNFFGADNNTTSYNINGQVIDAVIYIGQGVSGNFTPPTAPLIDSSGNINHYSGFSDSQLYFASPLVDVSGSTPNTIANYIQTGVNSFYLPMDGNSPIGEDKSPKGNNWTPVNFGGSVALDNPIVSGALPILNTTQGGTQAGVGVRTDAYHANLVLALPLIGSKDDVSNSVNSGSTTKAITSNGDPVASNAASNFYGGSFVFDGSGDYLSSSSSADLTFGTGNFTIECWVYQTSAASAEDGIFQISTTSGGLAATQSDTITLQTNGSVYRSYANNTSTPFSTAVITNKWVHLALVRSSTSLNLFVNGVKDATTISDSRNYSGTYLAIGGYYSTSYLWVGNISDFRVYKGVAKYTSNFVVPATSPDILPDTPSGVSGSSKLA
jgi:hypothetical protein